MSWIKIALLSIAWVGNTFSSTPPKHPQPKRRRPDSLALPLQFEKRITDAGGAFVGRVAISALILVEILFTFADAHRQSALSMRILNTLCRERASTAHANISLSFLLGTGLVTVGAFIRMMCYREMGALFVFEVSLHKEHKLVKTGPYGIVRHPSYVALVMTLAGVMASTLSPGSWWSEAHVSSTWEGGMIVLLWSWLSVYRALLLTRAPVEDAMLKKEFGKEWDEYATNVRYWFVPGLL